MKVNKQTKGTANCSECGAQATIALEDYPFQESGLTNVVLKGIEVTRCAKCDNVEATIPRLQKILEALAIALVKQPYPLKGEEVRYLRKHLGMSQAKFAQLLNIDKTNISKWENGEINIGPQSDRLIRLVVTALSGEMKAEIANVVETFPAMEDHRPDNPKVDMDAENLQYEYA